MGLLTTSEMPAEQAARNLTRKAILDAVGIFLDQGFSNPRPLNLRRFWEEVTGSAVGEMTRYRSMYIPRTGTAVEDPADLTCEMP